MGGFSCSEECDVNCTYFFLPVQSRKCCSDKKKTVIICEELFASCSYEG